VEVGARDGLQNEKQLIPTSIKVQLIERLAAAGVSVVEATSFVSPKWVPQMADAAEVMATIRQKPGVSYPVLTPNMKGLESALAAGVKEVAVFAAASESFSKRNINSTIEESLQKYKEVVDLALKSKLRVRGYVSCVLGCPYDGYIAPKEVARVSRALYDMGCYEISLGDTIGVGQPGSTRAMLQAVLAAKLPVDALAVHFHHTYGQALSNILTSVQMGVSVIDSSVGGLGGCPYAEGATGNVPTEDVVYMLHGMGIETGINFEALNDIGIWISGVLGRPTRSAVSLALSKKKAAKKDKKVEEEKPKTQQPRVPVNEPPIDWQGLPEHYENII
jgi:hydroxymethylglutaryl-CoA lyase